MLTLSSTHSAIERLAHARRVSLDAYTLGGPMLAALEAAARRGARVTVRLEAHPYDDASHHLGRRNAKIARELRRAGADARLADPIHAKTLEVDGTRYLDGKNWRADDIVLREDDPARAAAIVHDKREALALEAELLRAVRRSDAVIVESESFGFGTPVYAALAALGRAGAAPRLLVCRRDLRDSPRERFALGDLARAGVRVRLCDDSAKLALAGGRAWLGSANATYAGGEYAMPDWGACTRDARIVSAVRTRLDADWAAGTDLQ